MRKNCLLLLCGGLAFSVMAQSPENQTKSSAEYKVFFESNSYRLDKTAVATLERLIAETNAENLINIDLEAATDDKGEYSNNELLAQNRADAVRSFLLKEGLAANTIHIAPAILLTNELAQNSEERRRIHRSVSLRVWTKNADNTVSKEGAQDLKNFFVKEQENARQHFSFDAKTGMDIKGERGTRLKVPANCFVYANGAVVDGPVIFTLQEALSYGDMMMQDLSTTSGGRMLETGGMFYIAATDLKGNSLKIKEGAGIEASLPTRQAALSGMQVFEGVQDPHGNVDWAATGRGVQVNDLNQIGENRFSQMSYTMTDVATAIEELQALTKSAALGETPDFGKVKILKMPKQPASEPQTPVIEDFYAKYSQQKNESDNDYRKRIQGKFKPAKNAYYKERTAYNQAMNEYRRDMSVYERAKNEQNDKSKYYETYCNKLRKNVGDVIEILEKGNYYSYQTMVNQTAVPLNFKDYRLENFIKDCEGLRENIEFKIKEGHPFEDVLQSLDALGKIEYTVRDQWGMKHVFKSIDNQNINYTYAMGASKTDGLFRTIPALSDLKKDLPAIKEMLNEELFNKNTIKELQSFLINYDKMGGALLDGNSIAMIKKNYLRYKNKLADYLALEEKIKEVRLDYLSKCAQLGLLTPEQVSDVYTTAMEINSMGWINCDRFIDSKEPKTDMEILVENSSNTAVYVVFEDINSVIKAEPSAKGFVVKNVPTGKKVKVIGIHITGQSAEVFVEQTTVQRTSLQPQFEAKTLDELRGIMARV